MPTKPNKQSREEREAAVKVDRERQYGNATFGHGNLGEMWTAVIQQHYGIKVDHPLPAHVVELMMALNKVNRAVRGGGPLQDDDYDDGRIYFELAHNARLEAERSKPQGKGQKL